MQREGADNLGEVGNAFFFPFSLWAVGICSPFTQAIVEELYAGTAQITSPRDAGSGNFSCLFPSLGGAGVGASFTESHTCLQQVQERFLADGNDRLKLVVLLCGEEDDKLQNAAAGALAMLTAAHKKLCLKMTQVVTAGWGQKGAG